MSDAKLRVGVVGLGMWGENEAAAFANDPRCEVRWLATRNEKRMRGVGERFGIERRTTDYREMLADPLLDAVAVCTPPFTHQEYGLAVIEAGKHLLMEKPMGRTAEEAQRLVRAAEGHDGLVLSGCTARYGRLNAKFDAVKAMIDEGRLGRVYHIHHRDVKRQGRAGMEYNPGAKWFQDRAKAGGGPLLDWGGYDLAFHLGLVGDPAFESATAFCVRGLDKVDPGTPVADVEEHGAAMMRFEGGLTYYWERAGNAHGEAPHQSTVYGTRGGVRLGYCSWDSPDIEVFSVDDDGEGKARVDTVTVDIGLTPGEGDTAAMVSAFAAAVLDGKPLPLTPGREVANLRIIEEVYRAAGW